MSYFDNHSYYNFHGNFETYGTNGLLFNAFYLPEEVLFTILSRLSPTDLLNATLVCKKWCNIIKSTRFWKHLYSKKFPEKSRTLKQLPWYIYFAYLTNENIFSCKTVADGAECLIDSAPIISDPVVPEGCNIACHANLYKSKIFVRMHGNCQEITFKRNNLIRMLFDLYKPRISIREFIATKIECGCKFALKCNMYLKRSSERPATFTEEIPSSSTASSSEVLWSRNESIPSFLKSDYKETLIVDYPRGVDTIKLRLNKKQRLGGYYFERCVCKIAIGEMRILFDSIEPRMVDQITI